MLDVSRLVWRRWAGRHPTGIDRVCLAYLEHFGDRAQAVVQHPSFRRILDRKASQTLFRLLAEPGLAFRAQLIAGAIRHAGARTSPGKRRLYLNLGHTGLDKPGFVEWARSADVRPVYLIHDLIPITHPKFCREGESERHVKRMQAALDTATGIIGNSRATLDALRQFGISRKLPSPPEVAALLGSTPLPRPDSTADTDRPTFVVLGTIEARKNHSLLLKIWSRLVERMGDAAPRLMIIGQRGWEAEDVFQILDHGSGLRGHVMELSKASDEEVAERLSSSRALLFPTLAEGYGLPLVEALSLGVPVIASDLPVFREIGQNIPNYLDPLDEESWEAAIVDFANDDSPSRAGQLGKMEAFRAPRWSDHFSAVEQWLATLPA